MHAIQPKHIKLKKEEAEKILAKYGISQAQLPKIIKEDPGLAAGCEVGDIIRVERKDGEEIVDYFRIVV